MTRETQIVGFRVGRETYGVPITALHEIVRVPEITAVPDAPDYLEGVINLRGKIVSVIDLRKRFGQPATALDRRSRILADIGKRKRGLAIADGDRAAFAHFLQRAFIDVGGLLAGHLLI